MARPVMTATGTSAVQVWTLVVAGIAVLATLISAYLLRRTGKGTVDAAKQAAAASERSAQAAEKSAEAAQDSVGVNRETSAGIALRAEADALAKRYQDAAGQLGHDSPAVRIAGAYALAKLADDWAEQRQVCIDVICAYLRTPWPSEIGKPEVEDRSDQMVRSSIWELISSHLRHDGAVASWEDATFDFSGGTFREFRLYNLAFNTTPNFSRARFDGRGTFERCSFLRGATFDFSDIRNRLSFEDVFVSSTLLATNQGFSSQLSFSNAVIAASGNLVLRPLHISEEAKVVAFGFDVAGRLTIDRRPMKEPCGNFLFEGVRLQATSTVDIDGQVAAYSPDFGESGRGKPAIIFLALTILDGAQATVGREPVEVTERDWRP